MAQEDVKLLSTYSRIHEESAQANLHPESRRITAFASMAHGKDQNVKPIRFKLL